MIQPHNDEMERAVLTVLLDGRVSTAMPMARGIIKHPDVMFQRNHKIVWLAMCDLDDRGERVDAINVFEKLSRWSFQSAIDKLRVVSGLPVLTRKDRACPDDIGLEDYDDSALAAIGGHVALGEMTQVFAPAATLEKNCEKLVELYGKRTFITHIGRAQDMAATDAPLTDCLDAASATILEIGRSAGGNELFSAASAMDDSIQEAKERAAGKEDRIMGGWPKLDRILSGLRRGGLYILAARPGCGKTSAALSITSRLCIAKRRVMFVSLEVGREDLMRKALSHHSMIDFRTLDSGIMDPDQQEVADQSADEIRQWKLDIFDGSDMSAVGLRSMVKRQPQARQPELLVIDYLQLMTGSRRDMVEYEKVSEISRTLKVIARELKLPVLALAQMSRDSEKGTPREPRLSDLRGSGTLEQDADAVIFLHRVDQDENAAERHIKVIAKKNRFGPMGSFDSSFIPATMQFTDRDPIAEAETDAPTSRRERLNGPVSSDQDIF
jgi:replicative DNA helicase